MKKVSLENVAAKPFSINLDPPRIRKNVKAHDARICLHITCMKPTYGTCSTGNFKNNLRKMQRVLNFPHLKH